MQSIYVIKSEPGPLKIGIATNYLSRLSQLRVSSHLPLSLVYIAIVEGDAKVVEKGTHKLLESFRQKGEWFNISTEEAIKAIEISANESGVLVKSQDLPQKRKRRTAYDYVKTYRSKQIEAGSRRLSILLSPDAAQKAAELQTSTGKSLTQIVEKLLRDAT